MVVYPIIYRVFYIPGGVGFLPSTVSLEDFEMSDVFSQKKKIEYN